MKPGPFKYRGFWTSTRQPERIPLFRVLKGEASTVGLTRPPLFSDGDRWQGLARFPTTLSSAGTAKKQNASDLSTCQNVASSILPRYYRSSVTRSIGSDPESTVGGYLQFMLGRSGSPAGRSTYLAPAKLPSSASDCEGVLEDLNSLQTRSKLFRKNEIAYKYIIAELVDNIYEHSEFGLAYVMAQKYVRGGYIELVFFDDGITIPGSFDKHGMHYDKKQHKDAIIDAIRGKSTKPGRGRGYGLSTNVEMFRDIGGEVLIVSGYGAIYIDKGSVIPYALDTKSRMDGTLISLRVQDRAQIVNLYEYVQARSTV
jgi:hypothetical protein